MKIEWDGRPYELDLTDLELKAAVVITSYTGMSLLKWGEFLTSEDALDRPELFKVLGSVYWLMLQQNGVECPIADVNFKIGAFFDAVTQAMAAELKAAAEAAAAQRESEPDPTLPAGSEPSPEPASPTAPESTDGGETPDG